MFKSLTVVLFALSMLNAHALELLSHKSTSTNVVKLDAATVEKVWASNAPACLKDGSKLMGVNKAFRAKGLKYADCSSSANAKEKQRMLGYEVVVIRFTELPDAMARQVVGIK
jgi:hypothetical protein